LVTPVQDDTAIERLRCD
jgi:GAF domain-containing protein